MFDLSGYFGESTTVTRSDLADLAILMVHQSSPLFAQPAASVTDIVLQSN
jgi:hypothetical protein